MRIGDRVTHRDADDKRRTATITAVPGTGKSGFKTLNLALAGGETLENVPHEADYVAGEATDVGYWRELGAAALPDEPEPVEEQPAERKPKRRRQS